MLEALANFTDLSVGMLLLILVVALFSGLIRGFSGFALSATVMASLSAVIPPVELLPICVWLELIASIFMVRGGLKDADMKVVWGLVIGNTIGVPVGIFFLTWLDVETTKIVALVLILGLASIILSRVRIPFLATRAGLYASGITAGVIAGVAAVGGMVVALFVLAQNKSAARMRASLVMFLFISLIGTTLFLALYDLLTIISVNRALVMVPFLGLGIVIGSAFFNPAFERFYKPVCLIILMVICLFNLIQQFT